MIRFIPVLILLGVFLSWDYQSDFAATAAVYEMVTTATQDLWATVKANADTPR